MSAKDLGKSNRSVEKNLGGMVPGLGHKQFQENFFQPNNSNKVAPINTNITKHGSCNHGHGTHGGHGSFFKQQNGGEELRKTHAKLFKRDNAEAKKVKEDFKKNTLFELMQEEPDSPFEHARETGLIFGHIK